MTAVNGGTCDTCGDLNVAGTQFCTSCGSYLGWNAPAVPSTDDGAPPPPRAFRAAPPPPGGIDNTRPMARVAPAPPQISPTRAAAGTGTLPPRTVPAAGNVAVDVTCPSCVTGNAPTRRFCRHCGYVLQSPVARPRPVVVREPWWKRWFRRRPSAERAARASFRHSLSWRSRFFRGISLLLAVVAALGLLRFAGRDPAGWARHHLNDLRGTLVAVDGVSAAVDPPAAAVADFPPSAAVDGRTDTAWEAPVDAAAATTATAVTTCATTPGAGTALFVTAPRAIALRAVRVRSGLPEGDPNRPLQPRPKLLELRFSDGGCQQVTLQDNADPQVVDLTTVTTNVVRVSVVGTYPPAAPVPDGLVAITELNLLTRPA